MIYIDDLGIEALVGRTVKEVLINTEKDLILLQTDQGPLFLTWEGECCSACYIAHVSGSEALVGAKIISAENAEWQDVLRNEDAGRVIQSMGTNIKTDKGYVTFESRLQHNGYYGGMILISDEQPLDQYHSPRYEPGDEVPMDVLRDF